MARRGGAEQHGGGAGPPRGAARGAAGAIRDRDRARLGFSARRAGMLPTLLEYVLICYPIRFSSEHVLWVDTAAFREISREIGRRLGSGSVKTTESP